MDGVEDRLADLGFEIPDAPVPQANYVPYVIVDKLVFVSGQVSIAADGSLMTGKLGADVDLETGVKAAERCALALLAQARAAAGGDFAGLKRAVKLTGFVNSTPDFTQQPQVVNGASDLLVAALGEAGRHSRSAVSAGALPLGVAVEIEGIFELV